MYEKNQKKEVAEIMKITKLKDSFAAARYLLMFQLLLSWKLRFKGTG